MTTIESLAAPHRTAKLRGPLAAQLWAKTRLARNWIASARSESKLKVGFVSASAVLLWAGAFAFSWGGLRYLERFLLDTFGDAAARVIVDALFHRLLATLALSLFVLLSLSNILVAFGTMYRSQEVAFLVLSPLTRRQFFLGRFVECVSFSSWGLAFLGSPLLLAYGLMRGADPGYYAALLFFFLPFVVLPSAIGCIATIFLVRLFAGWRYGPLITVLAMLGTFVFLLFRAQAAIPRLNDADTINAILDVLGRSQWAILPSHWLSDGLLAASRNEFGSTLVRLAELWAAAVVAVGLAMEAANRFFYRGYCDIVSADEQREPRRRRSGGLEHFLFFLSAPNRSLVLKDVLVFLREPAQWSQFLIFFGLMGLYLANLTRDQGVLALEPFRSWVPILNMGASMLILATLTTRFVFPLISIEGKRFWILGLAPLTRRRLVLQKFGYSVGVTSVFTLVLVTISAVRLDLSLFELAVTGSGIVAANLTLSALAVGLGAVYPNFAEDNPARITSGLGGTLTFILSLVWITTIVVLQTAALALHHATVRGAEPAWSLVPLAGMAVAAAFGTWLPLRWGIRNLEAIDL